MDIRIIGLLSIAAIFVAALLYDDGHSALFSGFERTHTEAQEVKTEAYTRTTEWITYDRVNNLKLEGWLYRPHKTEQPPPVVVMAHGLGMIKDAGLEKFARVFCEHGLAVLTFDHRNFGGSDGIPRHHIKISDQILDWEKVLLHIQNNITDINNKKVALWGHSIESGNVLAVASTSLPHLKKQNITIAALILNAPIVDAFELIKNYHWRHISLKYGTGILLAIKDLLYSFFHQHRYVKIAAAPDDSIMSAIHDKDWEDYVKLVPAKPHGGWQNVLTASSLLQLIIHRPVLYASSVEVPTMVLLAKKDNYASESSVRNLAAKIEKVELVEYDIACFDFFSTPSQNKIAQEQAKFLTKHLAL